MPGASQGAVRMHTRLWPQISIKTGFLFLSAKLSVRGAMEGKEALQLVALDTGPRQLESI